MGRFGVDLRWYSFLLICLWLALLLYTVVCIMTGVTMGSCEGGTPNFLFYGIFAIMGVFSCVQAYFFIASASDFTSQVFLIGSIAIGVLNVLDFFTDGQQIALAHLCDDTFHDNFMRSMEQSALPAWCVSLVGILHLSGLLAISVILSLALQVVILCLLYQTTACREKIWSVL